MIKSEVHLNAADVKSRQHFQDKKLHFLCITKPIFSAFYVKDKKYLWMASNIGMINKHNDFNVSKKLSFDKKL